MRQMTHAAADGLRYRLQWDLAALCLMQGLWKPCGWLVNILFGGDAAHWAGIRMIAWWPLRRPVLVALPPVPEEHG